MTPIHLTAILTAPLLFPALHPVAAAIRGEGK